MTQILTLFWVLAIDVALSLDNAAVIALVTDKLPELQRRRALYGGIALAMGLRILCACFASALMKVAALSLVGGAYLIHVATKLACEQLGISYSIGALCRLLGIPVPFKSRPAAAPKERPASIRDAVVAIGLADLSMSMDNVLAVAGTAKHQPTIMTIGMTCSVLAMLLAATGIHKLMERWPRSIWIAVGLVFLTGFKLAVEGVIATA